jgi:hypothetical protein
MHVPQASGCDQAVRRGALDPVPGRDVGGCAASGRAVREHALPLHPLPPLTHRETHSPF